MSGKTAFQDLTQLFDLIAQTSKRTEKKKLISSFLTSLEHDEVQVATTFLTGQIFPETDSRVLEIGSRMLHELLQEDKQLTLTSSPLTLNAMNQVFSEIARTRGKGSRSKKKKLLRGLFSRSSPLERKYLVRLFLGELRIGVVEGITLEAIAELSSADIAFVHRANMLLGDIGKVAQIAITTGEKGLQNVQLELFTPIKPMLAEMMYSIEDVFTTHPEQAAFEYKFDGARVQIHIRHNKVKIYSRRLTEVTESIPEIINLVKKNVNVNEALLDGEVVAYGDKGKPLPFQELMRRFKRVHRIKIMQQQVPLNLFLFDILYLNGKLLIDETYAARWKQLSKICTSEMLTPRLITDEVNAARTFLQEAIHAGHEGIVAKALNSTYSPGIRGRKWFKIKPTETLDVIVVAADWGYGRRSNWLSNYHLAVYDPQMGILQNIGKTFKGLTDQEFEEMTLHLQQLKLRETSYTVYVQPEIVVEVTFNEIQRSPTYQSGFALRFARITRIRKDKNPDTADNLDRIRTLFKKQFQYKSKHQFALK
jgi:DNA ligase-1